MISETAKGKGVRMQATAKVQDADEYAECQKLMSGLSAQKVGCPVVQ